MVEKTGPADNFFFEGFMNERICIFQILVELLKDGEIHLFHILAGYGGESHHAGEMLCKKIGLWNHVIKSSKSIM